MPSGEKSKTLSMVENIYHLLCEKNYSRYSVIIALGGGIVGDTAGFVASTYNRGIDFIQIPTTLVAQVDSSVGGKTGVNFNYAKNIIGAFYSPILVYSSIDMLYSLPDRHYIAGLAEIIKYACILDINFFNFIKENKALIKKQG